MVWQNFEAFLNTIEGKPYGDMILMANSEATAVERRRLQSRKTIGEEESQGYAVQLKAFIRFMRYGVKPRCLPPEQIPRLQSIRGQALNRAPGQLPSPDDRPQPVAAPWRCA